MKPIAFLLAFALAAAPVAPALAATITPNQAAQHVGQMVTVEGVVADVHHAISGRATFIDMGGRYPKNRFAGVIFSYRLGRFADVDSLKGRTVDISGKVELYRGKPEIVLNDASQIKAK